MTTLLLTLFLGCPDPPVLKVRNDPPVVTLTSPVDGAALVEGAAVTLSGEVSDVQDDRDGLPLTVTWLADSEEICPGTVPDAGAVTCAWTATAGVTTLTLRARDVSGETVEDAVGVTVSANGAPSITLVSPTQDGEYYFDDAVTLEATVWDPESGAAELVVSWVSDVDGDLGEVAAASSGTASTAVVLSEGSHVLTATVTDPAGGTDVATVDLVVYGENTAPDCEVVSPASGTAVALGEVVLLEGTATDLETAPPALLLSLASQLESISDDVAVDDEGAFTAAWATTVAGTHVVTLTGQDSRGESCTDVLTIEVCDAAWYYDGDGDGAGDPDLAVIACDAPEGYVAGGDDCNDASAVVYPGAAYEESLTDCMQDGDGDGWGDDSVPGGVTAGTDCDDGEGAVNPDGDEVCDGADNDCDGTADGATASDASTWYADADNDGYGDAGTSTLDCDAPAGYVADRADCDDADRADHPGATEDCDGDDDDCDGSIDEEGTGTFYADGDGDGYGDSGVTTEGCSAPAGYVSDAADCDDADGDVFPGATEACDGVDEDCDGTIDDGAALTWYADDDGDGHGDVGDAVEQCSAPTGYVADDDDCHDGDADTFPGAAAEESPTACMQDRDGDGFGDDNPPSGVSAGTDCDDGSATVSPDGTEACNGDDDDCDGTADEGVTTTVYGDGDGDGYGDPAAPSSACAAGAGQAANADDCDDGDEDVSPAATEVCDSLDNDCDGDVDDDDADLDASTGEAFYADVDGDGFGDATSAIEACETPSGHVEDATDCDDGDATIYPWAGDTYSTAADEDCDGMRATAEALSGTDDYYAVGYCAGCDRSTAEAYCLTYGYDGLASLPSSAADTLVRDMGLDLTTVTSHMWIGLRSPFTTWDDGTPVSYTNWYPGDPAGRGSYAVKNMSSAYGYTWNDWTTSGIYALTFACSISGI